MIARLSSDPEPSLAQVIESRVRQTTHGRIRGLSVKEVHGQLVVHGHTTSHHTRQLALHAVLELTSVDICRSCITVG